MTKDTISKNEYWCESGTRTRSSFTFQAVGLVPAVQVTTELTVVHYLYTVKQNKVTTLCKNV